MILDVGCGGQPKGNVNCDLFIGKSPHTRCPIHKTNKFVMCDAHYLPFRESTFKVVYSSHLIEHLTNPLRAVKEMRRVSKKFVYIRVPNVTTMFRQRKEHLYTWDRDVLTNFLLKSFPKVNVYYTNPCGKFDGRLLVRMWILKRLVTSLTKKLLPNELTAICEVN